MFIHQIHTHTLFFLFVLFLFWFYIKHLWALGKIDIKKPMYYYYYKSTINVQCLFSVYSLQLFVWTSRLTHCLMLKKVLNKMWSWLVVFVVMYEQIKQTRYIWTETPEGKGHCKGLQKHGPHPDWGSCLQAYLYLQVVYMFVDLGEAFKWDPWRVLSYKQNPLSQQITFCIIQCWCVNTQHTTGCMFLIHVFNARNLPCFIQLHYLF